MAGEAMRESIGDAVSKWRGQNAADTLELAGKKLIKLGLDGVEGRQIKTAVALELLDKASLEDDRIFQEMWANLMVGAVKNGEGQDEVSIDTLQINALHHMNRIDCEVLKFLIESSCTEAVGRDGRRSLQVGLVSPRDLTKVHPSARISIEKLVHLGCAQAGELMPIDVARTYSPDERPSRERSVVPTLIGINLYISASGEWPKNLEGFADEARSEEGPTD